MAGRTRDAEATRRKLLDAAEAVFVEHGFDGARVDDIAARAGVNKRMIYEYFGNKEDLYFRVLKTNYDRLFEAERGVVCEPRDALTSASEGLRSYFRFLADNPGFVRLVGHDVVATSSRAGDELRDLAGTGLERLQALLARGIADGTFRSDLDLRMLVVAAASLCMGVFQRRALIERLWGLDLDDASIRDRFVTHLVTLFMDGVRPRVAGAEGRAA